MTPVAASLLLALTAPAAPALKGDRGLPKDLIDLLPEDTAAALVIDVPRVVRTELGALFLKVLVGEQEADSPVPLAALAEEAELIVIAQFLIDTGSGDFLFLIRLKAGSGLPKRLLGRAGKGGKDGIPVQIGKRTVRNLDGPNSSFALVDDRTVMVVGATGDDKQIEETRLAAYGDRERPGPRPALRKILAADPLGDRPVRLYGAHPSKLGYSARLVMALFGNELEEILAQDAIATYRGALRIGEAAEVDLRFTAKDAETAKRFLDTFDKLDPEDPFQRELRRSAKAVRDGEEVVITARVTRALIERLAFDPNK